jgi:hypothetical protein
VVAIDHHRPGDPGYGQGADSFLAASSLGQIIALLAKEGNLPTSWTRTRSGNFAYVRLPGTFSLGVFSDDGLWAVTILDDDPPPPAEDVGGHPLPAIPLKVIIPQRLVLAAAADHCLAAAYRGECLGVRPDDLMTWRAETRAAFQRRPVEAVLADVERARQVLRSAPVVWVSTQTTDHDDDPGMVAVADLRDQNVPELPEAAARDGIPFLATTAERDGREKIVLQAAPPAVVRAFLCGDLCPELADRYGDPERGFAGGYRR